MRRPCKQCGFPLTLREIKLGRVLCYECQAEQFPLGRELPQLDLFPEPDTFGEEVSLDQLLGLS